MARVKWIKICTDIFDDEKVVLIESMPEADGIIVIWFKLLCLAGKQNNGGVFMLNDKIAYTDDMLAHIFRRPLATVRLALKTFESFGMIEIVDNVVTIPKWQKHQSLDVLDKVRAQNKKRVADFREKHKRIAAGDCNVTVTLQKRYSNADVTGIDKEEDIEVSHESHACAHEEQADQKGYTFGKKEFLKKYPKLKDDLPTGLEDPEADWQGLSDAFKQSEWLRGIDSLVWVLRNSGKILSGKYKTFKSADSKTSHFENERQYDKDELNSLMRNIDDVEF